MSATSRVALHRRGMQVAIIPSHPFAKRILVYVPMILYNILNLILHYKRRNDFFTLHDGIVFNNTDLNIASFRYSLSYPNRPKIIASI